MPRRCVDEATFSRDGACQQIRLKGEVTSARHTLKPKIRPPTSAQYPAFARSRMPTPSAALMLSKKMFYACAFHSRLGCASQHQHSREPSGTELLAEPPHSDPETPCELLRHLFG